MRPKHDTRGTRGFTDAELRSLLIPVLIEQLLSVSMGVADTVMVSTCGESAVSAVSLVDTVSILAIYLFNAMAQGGSVVAAQYMGSGDQRATGRAAWHLFLAVILVSVPLMLLGFFGRELLIGLVYPSVEPGVRDRAVRYLGVIALSFPALGIYNGMASLFRISGDAKTAMMASAVSNCLNIAGNALLIYGLRMDVFGAGLATTLSRYFAALLLIRLFQKRQIIRIGDHRFSGAMLQKVLRIGIPGAIENSVFQVGKIIVSGMIAGLGTAAITANAVAMNLQTIQTIPTSAVAVSMTTVVGRCIGASEDEAALCYLKRLLRAAYIGVIAIGAVLITGAGPICRAYGLQGETAALTRQLIFYGSTLVMLVHPLSFGLPGSLRAAGDVKYPMIVAIVSMWSLRIGLAYFLGIVHHLGILGIFIAMTMDWTFRALCFVHRIRSGAWRKHERDIVGS